MFPQKAALLFSALI